ncbi:MAG: MIP family channel protein [Vampirovibrionales bacterium]|nr:MIP family channel protein [Vampirovibrionales bacterium]
MKKLIAEFMATFTLVFVGCGCAVIAGSQVGAVGIALAFGLTIVALAYGFGPISGCHINPAVTIGLFAAGRFPARDVLGYMMAQCVGAIAGSALLLYVVNGQLTGYDLMRQGLGQNGWGAGYLGQYSQHAAFAFEFVATTLFVLVIIGATQHRDASKSMAGLAIGLTLSALILMGLSITGVSLNPARSLGPAIFVGGQAMSQLWLFVIAPLLGGVTAGIISRGLILSSETTA